MALCRLALFEETRWRSWWELRVGGVLAGFRRGRAEVGVVCGMADGAGAGGFGGGLGVWRVGRRGEVGVKGLW